MNERKGLIRSISSSAPARFIARGSKKVFIPGFHGFSLYKVWSYLMGQLRKTSIIERASGISFNIFMAIPPTLIFLFTLIPYLPISKGFIRQLFALIRDVVPGEKNNSIIINFLNDFIKKPRTGLLSFGLLVAIFFSSNAMMGILRSFDKDYSGFIHRRNWQRRKIALKLTSITYLLVFLCILLLMAQAAVLKWAGVHNESIRTVISTVRWLFIFALTFYIVAFIYRHGPSITKKWPLVTAGAVFATTLMIIATALVSFWANNFNTYNKLYGSISAVFILMSLIYVNALAILIGFELNVTITHLQEAKEMDRR